MRGFGTKVGRAVCRLSEKVRMDDADTNNIPPTETVENEMTPVLQRLTTVLAQENEILESADEADHANYIIAKNQALRELIVMYRVHQKSAYTPELLQRLHEVRKLIDRNSQLLNL
jgi:hypothetical protein